MSLRDRLDADASSLPETDPYEVAISIASAADRYANDDASPDNEAAVALREVFGTWAARIEAYGTPTGNLAAADEAQGLIVAALTQWNSADPDKDMTAFAMEWRSKLGEVDTGWLDRPAYPLVRASPMVRVSWLRRVFGRCSMS